MIIYSYLDKTNVSLTSLSRLCLRKSNNTWSQRESGV
jgi:hypothetical protein